MTLEGGVAEAFKAAQETAEAMRAVLAGVSLETMGGAELKQLMGVKVTAKVTQEAFVQACEKFPAGYPKTVAVRLGAAMTHVWMDLVDYQVAPWGKPGTAPAMDLKYPLVLVRWQTATGGVYGVAGASEPPLWVQVIDIQRSAERLVLEVHRGEGPALFNPQGVRAKPTLRAVDQLRFLPLEDVEEMAQRHRGGLLEVRPGEWWQWAWVELKANERGTPALLYVDQQYMLNPVDRSSPEAAAKPWADLYARLLLGEE